MKLVRLETTMPEAEVREIDRLGRLLGGGWGRRGAIRALIRFALANEEEFIKQYKETEGELVRSDS